MGKDQRHYRGRQHSVEAMLTPHPLTKLPSDYARQRPRSWHPSASNPTAVTKVGCSTRFALGETAIPGAGTPVDQLLGERGKVLFACARRLVPAE